VKRLAVVALVLAGCATQSFLGSDGPTLRGAQASWVSPDANRSGAFLFVSDFANFDVYVYRISPFKLVEKITGFFQPQGECSDAHGHIWVSNTGTQQMLEFKPGAVRPIESLDDSLGFPVGCAIDAVSGDLAVTNLFDGSGAGGIVVYRHARGTPTLYTSANQFYYYFAGYDGAGDLYSSGLTSKNAYALSTLPHGAKRMSPVRIEGGRLHFPGTVLWNGSALVLGDQRCGGAKTSCLYEATVSGTTATIEKRIPLAQSCDVAQVVLQGYDLYGGNYDGPGCARGKSSVDAWKFPSGGRPVDSTSGIAQPVGAAIVSE
jgi:hypothetical protein